MRVLGCDVSANEIKWVILDGTSSSGGVEPLPGNKLPLPQTYATAIENLVTLQKLIQQTLPPLRLDAVGIIRADKDSSSMRTKIECMIELACFSLKIPCALVPIQTVNAAMKRKVPEITGSSLEDAFNSGAGISPKYLNRACYCAWCVLNGSK